MAPLKPRRLVDQFLRGDIQQLVLGGAVEHPLLADLQQHRHGKRRDAVEPAIFDAAPRAPQQVAQALQVGELPGGVLAGGAQQDVVGFVLARLGLGIEAGVETRLLIIAAAVTTVWSGLSYLARCGRVLFGAEQRS